jgi:hypothetical protein
MVDHESVVGVGVGVGLGALTVTAAVALFVGSAWLVAITWYVPAVDGAVYTPALVTEPPAPSRTLHVTAWFALFATEAVNATVAPVETEAVIGLTLTATGGADTVTVAVAV